MITSLDLAKRAEILPGLRQVHWDLVIVDEAHRMSAADEPTRASLRLGELLRDSQRPHSPADRDARTRAIRPTSASSCNCSMPTPTPT